MPLQIRLQLPEGQGLRGQHACAESGADSSGADVGRAAEPHACGVLPGARGLCTLDQTPGPALSSLAREKGHLPTMRHEAPMQVGLQRKSGLGSIRERGFSSLSGDVLMKDRVVQYLSGLRKETESGK